MLEIDDLDFWGYSSHFEKIKNGNKKLNREQLNILTLNYYNLSMGLQVNIIFEI